MSNRKLHFKWFCEVDEDGYESYDLKRSRLDFHPIAVIVANDMSVPLSEDQNAVLYLFYPSKDSWSETLMSLPEAKAIGLCHARSLLHPSPIVDQSPLHS